MSEFSLAHLTTLQCSPPELIHNASLSGYEYVGIRPIFMGLKGEPNYALAKNPDLLEKTRRALDETDVKIHDIELARIVDNLDIRGEYLPAMKIGSELGARCIISSVWTENRSYAVEKFKELCDVAGDLGLKVSLEFVTWSNLIDLKRTLEFLDEANRKNAGLLIDTLHFYRSKVSLDELDEIPPELVHFFHLCDGPADIPVKEEELARTGRAERYYVGEGVSPIKSIVAKFPEAVCSIELPHLKREEELGSMEFAKRCLTTAKSYLQ